MPSAPEHPWWHAVPAWLARPRTAIVVTAAVLALALPPAVWVLATPPDDLTQFAVAQGLSMVQNHPAFQEMDAARRAEVPQRIGTMFARILTPLRAFAVLFPLLFTALVWGALAWLRRVHRTPLEPPPAEADARDTGARWLFGGAFLAAIAAHLPFMLTELHVDELAAALAIQAGPLAWADTRGGWQVHVAANGFMKLGAMLLGDNLFAVRGPLIALCAAGAAGFFAWQARAVTLPVAITTGLLTMALPVWQQFTSYGRAYPVTYFGGALATAAASALLLGGLTRRDAGRAFAALIMGFALASAAHFFVLFFAMGVIGWLAYQAHTQRRPDWGDAAFWVALACLPAGILWTAGLPATLVQQRAAGLPLLQNLRVLAERFAVETSLGYAHPIMWLTVAVAAVAVIMGLREIPAPLRRFYAAALVAAVGIPALLNPVYFYPRFFLHLVPLVAFAAAAGAIAVCRRFVKAPWALWAPAVVAGVLVMIPSRHAWKDQIPAREAATALRDSEAAGLATGASSFLHVVRYYEPGLKTAFRNAALPWPEPIGVVALQADVGGAEPTPAVQAGGRPFRLAQRFEGSEFAVLIYRRE